MIDYTFKTYIADGREFFEYGKTELPRSAVTKKDFPFPESLLSLLYMDVWTLEPLTRKIDQELLELYQDHNERHVRTVLSALDELACQHIYFELLRLDWSSRLERAMLSDPINLPDLLPHKEISHIPSSLDQIQKQLMALITNVLDIDRSKASVPNRMAEYYHDNRDDTLNTFQFKPLPLSFEYVDQDTFVETLCPKSIYDLIDFHLRECVKLEQKMRVCKNCGKYFAITGRSSAEYCGRVFDGKGRTCKDIGAITYWAKSKGDDPVFKEYRREYKRRFAWIKAGRIEPQELYDWGEIARAKKAECDEGKITLEEYSEWLRNS